ncbi:MAG: type II toxin-antitoxin system VapC family toxin [Actinomycetota bacterium]
MIYLDSSAFVKLIWSERETASLQQFLAERMEAPLVSSALLTLEVRRALLREDPSQMPRADLLLTRIGQVDVTRAVIEAAGCLPDPHLRSLDAIHLATALLLRENLEAFVTYDKRLASGAETLRLPIAMPSG